MAHKHPHAASKNIKVAFFLNFAFTLVEIVGGILTNSTAILADAIHDWATRSPWGRPGILKA